jgi:hypothetical protein
VKHCQATKDGDDAWLVSPFLASVTPAKRELIPLKLENQRIDDERARAEEAEKGRVRIEFDANER